MLRQSISTFLIIIGSALLTALGLRFAVNTNIVTLPCLGEQVELRIAVPAERMVQYENAIAALANDNSCIRVAIESADGLTTVESFRTRQAHELPHIWIAEATFVADLAQAYDAPYAPSGIEMSSSTLAWGIFQDRAAVLDQVDWFAVQQVAQVERWDQVGGRPEWGYVKLVLPPNEIDCMASLLSAAASFHQVSNLDVGHIVDPEFHLWFEPVIESLSTLPRLDSNPAYSLVLGGSSLADVALLRESDWMQIPAQRRTDLRFAAPQFGVALDYPLQVHTDLAAAEQWAVGNFIRQLMGSNGQSAAALDPLPLTLDGIEDVSNIVVDSEGMVALTSLAQRWQICAE